MSRIKLKKAPLSIVLALIIGILIAVTAFYLMSGQAEAPKRLTMIENNELRTGPEAAYPVIFEVQKGEQFAIIERRGKWFYVQGDDKIGWIAGWHTNLNIAKDQVVQQNPFKGRTVIVDPGHGGSDQGASSKSGTLEKEVTLKTGLMLRDKLKAEGARVIMTRDSDEYVKLKDRQGVADAFISIHSDALGESSPHGLTVYYYKDSQKPLADTLHLAIKNKTLLSDRGVRQENFQVIRQTKIPAVLLELGYISNPTDELMMTDKTDRQLVTTAIVDGLRNYFLY
ncbi:N-acetylmuramoyl-L-alanine amidase [Macrococcus equipercicus]|uniref:N-acetylmuramoyl-L-alanine amidase n=1 Tax=Macrococcus equipercicus TaxID=69967 RepID=A0A9Q9BM42_9STAP|nr:N-acetylmuramoyl-L-alanine amidase [Macrococcus equipercicus]KAA1040017.1 SH3 domain-containing protein [Macrococcus equipercicus]UTH13050.1 N-acetylmuramoyl-L-alanine amidase [Macrococcus equipercicus]